MSGSPPGMQAWLQGQLKGHHQIGEEIPRHGCRVSRQGSSTAASPAPLTREWVCPSWPRRCTSRTRAGATASPARPSQSPPSP